MYNQVYTGRSGDRSFGFFGPFLLGGITGGLLRPNRPCCYNNYYPYPYPYYPRYNQGYYPYY